MARIPGRASPTTPAAVVPVGVSGHFAPPAPHPLAIVGTHSTSVVVRKLPICRRDEYHCSTNIMFIQINRHYIVHCSAVSCSSCAHIKILFNETPRGTMNATHTRFYAKTHCISNTRVCGPSYALEMPASKVQSK